jgi:hypothetical protein
VAEIQMELKSLKYFHNSVNMNNKQVDGIRTCDTNTHKNKTWFDVSNSTDQNFVRYELYPKRIWRINHGIPQEIPCTVSLNESGFKLSANNGGFTSLIFDFEQEINGGIRIRTGWPCNNQWAANLRLRFGESLSEVLNVPLNVHAIHDVCFDIPALGEHEFGNTGFRFFRLDINGNAELSIVKLTAVAKERPFKYKGYFESSNKLLNNIWLTGARTVHLCCQDVILDGIKRDRMLWVGDLHPQIKAIESAFGNEDVVGHTLVQANNSLSKDGWHNGICSYTIWWLKSLWDWYFYTGTFEWLYALKDPIVESINRILTHIDQNGLENLSGWRFVDWTLEQEDDKKSQALQALSIMAVQASLTLAEVLNEKVLLNKCRNIYDKMRNIKDYLLLSKQANSMYILAGIRSEWDIEISQNFASSDGISTWYAYYYLLALAKTNYHRAALDLIKRYWGGMLNLGATTFWEHFEEGWLENAARIDELPKANQVDVHKTYGEHCYIGLRHSLCHGWAAGPTAWLSKHVLGIKPLSPGCKKIMISPWLGNLDYVRGGFPLPDGEVINVEICKKDGNDECVINYDAPPNVEVIINEQVKAS